MLAPHRSTKAKLSKNNCFAHQTISSRPLFVSVCSDCDFIFPGYSISSLAIYLFFFATLSEEEALCDPFFLVMQWRLFFWVKYYLVVPQGATAYTQIRTIGEISYGVEAARPVRVKEIARPSHRHELQKYLKGQTRRAVRFHCFASNICTHGMHMRSTSSFVFA